MTARLTVAIIVGLNAWNDFVIVFAFQQNQGQRHGDRKILQRDRMIFDGLGRDAGGRGDHRAAGRIGFVLL